MKEKRTGGRRSRVAIESLQRSYIAALGALSWNFEAACRAKNVPRKTVESWLKNPAFLAELHKRREILATAADITAIEVIGLIASQMRADIADVLPDEPIVIAARKAGVSHLIKELDVREIVKRSLSTGDDVEVVERHVKVKLHDSQKAAQMLTKLMGLEARDDELERTRTAIRTAMAMLDLTADEAILKITPHYPAAPRLREEFAGSSGPTINVEPSSA